MADVAPVFSEYKLLFARRRLSETWLGGVRLVVQPSSQDEGSNNAWVARRVIALQAGLYLSPMLLIMAAAAIEITPDSPGEIHSWDASLVCGLSLGAVLGLWVVLVRQVLKWALKKSTVIAKGGEDSGLDIEAFALPGGLSLEEEEAVDLASVAGVCEFVFDLSAASRNWHRLAGAFCTGVAFGISFRRSLLSGQISEIVSAWLALPAVAMAIYAIAVRHPPEISSWRAGQGSGAWSPMMRGTHVVLFCVLSGFYVSWAVALLPVLWGIGLLPTLDVLVEWFAEQANLFMFGGSAGASPSRVALNLFNSVLSSTFLVVLLFLSFGVMDVMSSVLWAQASTLVVAGILACALSRGWLIAICKGGRHNDSNLKGAGVVPLLGSFSPPKLTTSLPMNYTHEVLYCCVLCGLCLLGSLASQGVAQSKGLLVALSGICAVSSLVANLRLASPKERGCFAAWKPLLLVNPVFAVKVTTCAGFFTCLIFCVVIVPEMSLLSDDLSKSNTQAVSFVLSGIGILRALRVGCNSPACAAVELFSALVLGLLLDASNNLESQTPGGPLWSTTAARMMVLGLLFARIQGFYFRMRFCVMHVLSASSNPKLRLKPSWDRAARLFLPTIDVLVCFVASLLDSPVVPIAGAPFFVPGFPRPKRLWPAPVPDSSADTWGGPDAGYYSQAAARIAQALPNLWSRGLARPSRYGTTILLVRFEKMIAWISFLEAESGYTTFYIKGLELQEPTSCHNVEANQLDDFLSLKLGQNVDINTSYLQPSMAENDDENAQAIECSLLKPLVKEPILCYSHSSVSLTGIMDSPDFRKLVDTALIHSLMWHLSERSDVQGCDVTQCCAALPSNGNRHGDCVPAFPTEWDAFLEGGSAAASRQSELRESGPQGPVGPLGDDDFDIDELLDALEESSFSSPSQYDSKKPGSIGLGVKAQGSCPDSVDIKKDISKDTSTNAFALAIDAGPNLGNHAKKFGLKPKEHCTFEPENPEVPSPDTGHHESGMSPACDSPSDDLAADDSLDFLDDLDDFHIPQETSQRSNKNFKQQVVFQKARTKIPAENVGGSSTNDLRETLRTRENPEENDSDQEIVQDIAIWNKGPQKNAWRGSDKVKKSNKSVPTASSKSRGSEADIALQPNPIPRNQTASPFSPDTPSPIPSEDEVIKKSSSILNVLNSSLENKTTKDRIKLVAHVEASPVPAQKLSHVSKAPALADRERLVQFLFKAIRQPSADSRNRSGSTSSVSMMPPSPAQVVALFAGDFPKGVESRWLKAHPLLLDVALTSFRRAFKLALDAFILGDPDMSFHDYEAINACLESYARDWVIALPSQSQWGTALAEEKPHLLALVTDEEKDGRAGVLQLSLATESTSFSLVDPHIAMSLWASLSMELLYLTNDDDERYSIQAHPNFLRNLLVQAAAEPFGYPVFVSKHFSTHL